MPDTIDETRYTRMEGLLVILQPRTARDDGGLTRGETMSAIAQAGLKVEMMGDGSNRPSTADLVQAIARQPRNTLVVMRDFQSYFAANIGVKLFEGIARSTATPLSFLIENNPANPTHHVFARKMRPGNALATVAGEDPKASAARIDHAIEGLREWVGPRSGLTLENFLSCIMQAPELPPVVAKLTVSGQRVGGASGPRLGFSRPVRHSGPSSMGT